MGRMSEKIERIHELHSLGYNTPRIMKIPYGTTIDDYWVSKMYDLACGDLLMTVRTYHPVDEISNPNGPFEPEQPVEKAIRYVKKFIKKWHVLWQEAIDVNDTDIAGNILIRSDGSGHYDILKGLYRVREVSNPSKEATKDFYSVSFRSVESTEDQDMRKVVDVIRDIPQKINRPLKNGEIIVEFNLQKHPVGELKKKLLLWEWRPVELIEKGKDIKRTHKIPTDVSNGEYIYSLGLSDYAIESEEKRAVALLGNKGSRLQKMTSNGLPIPPGFVVSTLVFKKFMENNRTLSDDVIKEIGSALNQIRDTTSFVLGKERPLLFSIRSSAVVSMPGILHTITNAGLNPDIIDILARQTEDPLRVLDLGKRFLLSWSTACTDKIEFIHKIKTGFNKILSNYQKDNISPQDVRHIYEYWIKELENIEIFVPDDPAEQIIEGVKAVMKFWWSNRVIAYRTRNEIEELFGPAVVVQSMVYGSMNQRSGTGVGFTRNPKTGIPHPEIEFLRGVQGEDIVSGVSTPLTTEEFKKKEPCLYTKIEEYSSKLETIFRDMQDFEFTVETDRFFLLQTRDGGRQDTAAVRIAYDMNKDGIISDKEVFERTKKINLDDMKIPMLKDAGMIPLATAATASMGIGAGQVAFSKEEALQNASEDIPVIFVCNNLSVSDYEILEDVEGILSICGGITSHMAILMRKFKKVYLTNCPAMELNLQKKQIKFNNIIISEGDYITLDGLHGRIYSGILKEARSQLPEGINEEIISWAKNLRKSMTGLKVKF